uniref:Fas-binding factor 1 n=1 Tax=Steinernema glaseri TaxID=37863 RepID=A0A1I8AQT7_9BILA
MPAYVASCPLHARHLIRLLDNAPPAKLPLGSVATPMDDDDLDIALPGNKGQKTILDDLFGAPKRATSASRTQSRGGDLGDLFSSGPSSRPSSGKKPHVTFESDAKKKDSLEDLLVEKPAKGLQAPPGNPSASREVEQLRRELSELRYEREEEQKATRDARQSLGSIRAEHQRELDDLRDQHRRQISELTSQHAMEIASLKAGFDAERSRLLADQSRQGEVEKVVDKVESMKEYLERISGSVTRLGDRQALEAEELRRASEAELQERRRQLAEETRLLQAEKRKVEQINAQLMDVFERHKLLLEQDKQSLEEERRRLADEKQKFKTDQRELLYMLERRKMEIDADKSGFMAEQQNLLVRVMSERAALDEEKKQFARQRDADVARIREEAEQLEHKVLQVDRALGALENARSMYSSKHSHLVQLEEVLMEECVKLERFRGAIADHPTKETPYF